MTSNNKTKGFLYYAHNGAINYLKLSICSALSGRFQLSEFKATVVTDVESISSLDDSDRGLLYDLFEKVIIDDFFKVEQDNTRFVVDGQTTHGIQAWYNKTRFNAYEDSDYDETILIDVDFIFQDNNLEKLWGSEMPILMNKKIVPVLNEDDSRKLGFAKSEMVGGFTIPMFWATVVYFDRSDFSRDFFNMVNHIQDNYFYYQKLYQVNDKSYRNDFSFSIALHILNGYRTPGQEWEIPYGFVLSRQYDTVFRVDRGQILLILDVRNRKNPHQLFNVQKMSLHCMNKISLLEHYDRFIKVYT